MSRLRLWFRMLRRTWRDVRAALRRRPFQAFDETRDDILDRVIAQRDELRELVDSPRVVRWCFELRDDGVQFFREGEVPCRYVEAHSLRLRARPFSVPLALCDPAGETLAVNRRIDPELLARAQYASAIWRAEIDRMGQELGSALARTLVRQNEGE